MTVTLQDDGVRFIDGDHYVFIPKIQFDGMTIAGLIYRLKVYTNQMKEEKKTK